mgnify:CR=1 FL=1
MSRGRVMIKPSGKKGLLLKQSDAGNWVWVWTVEV